MGDTSVFKNDVKGDYTLTLLFTGSGDDEGGEEMVMGTRYTHTRRWETWLSCMCKLQLHEMLQM